MTTKLIYDEILLRGWKVEILDEQKNFLRFWDDSGKHHLLKNDNTEKTSLINFYIAKDKQITYKLAADLGIPIPNTLAFTEMEGAEEFLGREGRVVVKPQDSAHGQGVTAGIVDVSKLHTAIKFAQAYSNKPLIQTHVEGDDYRLLYIDKKLVAATIREPASIVGDGKQSISELILAENQNPKRGKNYVKELNVIDEAAAVEYLGDRVSEVPRKDEKVQVIGVANMGRGGKAIDVTDNVSSQMLEYASKIVNYLDMGLCGVDFIYNTKDNQMFLIEINAAPSFGLHEHPSVGKGRNVAKSFVDWFAK
ncbi:ATP-grasp domain-containing protein [Candidatus Saccharibacteria bacterium]|nr:ATP-grasp domain-containing protein [Candidatus Saccharibacteria bacterium]